MSILSTILQHTPEATDMTYNTLIEAYEQAEIFMTFGFEVTAPTSYDGVSYTITIRK